MPEPITRAEDAGLYVLDLLDPEARRAFEAELAISPELQRQVVDLQSNLEALAVAAPPRVPPARVWGAIARRTAEAPGATEPTPTAWHWVRRWLASGWAVAGILAAAFLIQWGSALLPTRMARSEVPDFAARDAAAGSGDAAGTRAKSGPKGIGPPPPRSPSGAGPGVASRSQAVDGEAERLRDRVRLLSDQVSWLMHVLTQRAVVPAGAARLQVFRLVGTNGMPELTGASGPDFRAPGPAAPVQSTPATPDVAATSPTPRPATTVPEASETAPDYTYALALTAARQLASTAPLQTPPNRFLTDPAGRTPISTDAVPGSGLAEDAGAGLATGGDVSNPSAAGHPEPIQIVDLSTSSPVVTTLPGGTDQDPVSAPVAGAAADPALVSASDGSAFGAYAPDTGAGAIAFRVPASGDEHGVLQLWMTDPQSGLTTSLGYAPLGTWTVDSSVLVMRFQYEGITGSMPTFMVTREPPGGSIVPTGPVVVHPPTNTPHPPNP